MKRCYFTPSDCFNLPSSMNLTPSKLKVYFPVGYIYIVCHKKFIQIGLIFPYKYKISNERYQLLTFFYPGRK